jgi:hypothetical protein
MIGPAKSKQTAGRCAIPAILLNIDPELSLTGGE